MAPSLLAKDTSAAQNERQATDKLELAAPAQLADQQKQSLQYKSLPTVASANRAAPAPVRNGRAFRVRRRRTERGQVFCCHPTVRANRTGNHRKGPL